MVAHNIKHAVACPSYGNGILARCTCGQVTADERGPRRSKASIESDQALRERVIDVQRQAWIHVSVAKGRTAEIQAALQPGNGFTVARCDNEVLEYVADAVSMMSMRIVRLCRPLDWDCTSELKIEVHQCCPVCRESYQTVIAQGEESVPMHLVAMVGGEARRARMRHRCHPITRDAASILTHEDLSTIAAELERDGTSMVKRSQELSKVADDRAAQAAVTAVTEATRKEPT